MKKNFIFRLLLPLILFISLHSCRTDESVTAEEQTQKEKIAFFERFEKNRALLRNASGNYAIPFGQSIMAYFEKYPEKRTELESKYGVIDLKVSSQDIGGDEGDNRKLLFFPMLKDGKVTAVIAGVVSAERDYLYFDVHQNTHADVFYLINTFQEHYETKTVSKNSNNPIDVGEVIINVTRPVKLTIYDGWSGNGGLGNGGHDMSGGNGDFNDGGGSGSQSSADKIDIEKLKDFPCAYDIAQQLPNLSNNLAKLLKNTFGSSDKINVTFIPKDGMDPKTDGYTAGGGSVQGGRLNATIYLNADMLKKASKEYILVTMYHEVTHAYLYAERIRLGSKEAFEAQYPKIECYDVTTPNGEVIQRFTFINENSSDSHPRFTSFINLLENALSAYNPSLSKDIIKALVKTGIFSDLTNQENKLNQNERDTSTGQSKGTKCP